MTDSSSREKGRPTSTEPQLTDSNKNIVLGHGWSWKPRLTGRQTVGCNVTDFDLTLKLPDRQVV
jgi:hypothetical protein